MSKTQSQFPIDINDEKEANYRLPFSKYKHLRIPNLYQTKKVCENWFEALSKIDKHRKVFIQNFKKKHESEISENQDETITQDSLQLQFLPLKKIKKKQKKKFEVFTVSDSHIPVKLKNLKEMSKYVPTYLIAQNMAMSCRIMKRALSQPQIKEVIEDQTLLPKMRKDLKTSKGANSNKNIGTIHDIRELPEKISKTAFLQACMVSNRNSELLGVKYHLGHTAYLPKDFISSDRKFYLTKSSIAINKLKDMMHIVDNIEFKLKSIRDEEVGLDKAKNTWLKSNDINFENLKQTTKKFQSKPDSAISEFELSYFNWISPKEEVSQRIDIKNIDACSLSGELEKEKIHLERIQNELNFKSAFIDRTDNNSEASSSETSEENHDKLSISNDFKEVNKALGKHPIEYKLKSDKAFDQSKEFSRFDYDPIHQK